MTNSQSTLGDENVPSAQEFLSTTGDNDMVRFLRRLPMVAGQEEDDLTLGDLIYEMKLWPFVKQAWTEIEGSPGIPERLRQLTLVYKTAEAELERLTGETRRLQRIIDLPAFIDIYATDGLS